MYQSLYDDLNDFDLRTHSLSAYGSRDFEDYDASLSYSYSHTFLGGERLMEIHTVSPGVGFSGISNWYHRIGYGYQAKNFFSTHDRDGIQHGLTADNYYFFMEGQAYMHMGIRLEDEDTSGSEFDYFGKYMNLGAAIPIRIGTFTPKLNISYQYYWRDFDNITASIGRKRDDERETASIELTQRITDDMVIKLNYQAIDADSNLPSSDFIEHITSLSIQANF